MRKLWIEGICILMLVCGCMQREIYRIEKQEKAESYIAQDAYFLAGQSLTTIEKSSYEEAEVVYYARDEMELAKIIQSAFEMGTYEIAYQSEKEMDIHEVASILSYVNPFDLSITQNVVKYTSNNQTELYASYHVTFENMDARYEEALKQAEELHQQLIQEEMTQNEKIKVIHDYIITHTIYDVEAQASKDKGLDVFKSAGVFTDHKAVCTGYSRAFMMLAREAQIPAIYVSSEAMNHSWNYVYDGDTWRYIDVTWDDPVPDRKHFADDRFLQVPKEMFLLDGVHSLSQEEQSIVEKIAENFF